MSVSSGAVALTIPDGALGARSRSLADIVEAHARTQPDSVALVDDEGTLTWSGLQRQITEMTAGLQERGVDRGVVVAVADTMSTELVSLYFATARLGALLVPLNTNLPAANLASYLARTRPRLVAAGQRYGHLVPADAAVTRIIADASTSWGEQLRRPASAGAEESQLDDPHLIIFTSGTTGVPKAAVLSQRGTWFDAYAGAVAAGLRATDRLYCYQAPYHTGSWAMIRQYLLVGGSVVISGSFDADRCLDSLERHRCTALFAVPLMLQKLVNSGRFEHADLSAFKRLVFASFDPSTVIAPAARMFRERGAAALTLEHIYGMTENCSLITTARAEFCEDDLTSVGSPVPGVTVAIQRPDGAVADPGETGEICVRSNSLMLGYLDDPEATAQAFRGGWLHTGDLGQVDPKGRLHIVGRLKEMVRTGGVNVYPREVASVLGEHPDVADCAVFGVPDSRYDERLVAAVVAARHDVQEGELIAFVRRRLAGYQTPRQILFVDEIPKSAAGKTATNELISRARSVLGTQESSRLPGPREASQTGVDR